MKRYHNKNCRASWFKVFFDAGSRWTRFKLAKLPGEGRFYIEPHYRPLTVEGSDRRSAQLVPAGSNIYFESKNDAVLFALKGGHGLKEL